MFIRSPPLRVTAIDNPPSVRPKSAVVNQSNKTHVNFSSGEEELYEEVSSEFTSTPSLVPKAPKRVWGEENYSKNSRKKINF